ncbi:hypothetical protein [Kutzneria kofuensis]|uniref:D-alanyl-D-alanine dipeptidase n=1 Tax=Kutzneria kofuensis TaxID=103725 RepID=A0A7W9KN32_9PSEU|nr:hypothetical protein [Kutzneria kofuensis]MBB5895605.1 D-alanyl-D-alanine dipeptidase [Kutzneria kofuensis]
MWGRWPAWVPWVTAVWGVCYAGVQVGWVLAGAQLPLGPHFAFPAWVQVFLALAAVVAAVAAVRGHVPLLFVTTIVFGIGTFGSPMELVALASGSGDGVGGIALVHMALDVLGVGPLLATLVSRLRVSRGRCPRCGRDHPGGYGGPLVHPAASTAGRGVRWTVYSAMLGVVPWAATKIVWTLGGTALGVTGEQWRAANAGDSALMNALSSAGIDFTVLAAVACGLLMLSLVQRWGTRLPRLLPLPPAWLTGVSLGAYGIVLTVLSAAWLLGLVAPPAPVWPLPTATDTAWMTGFGGLAFGGLGIGLLVAAGSYAGRTRPRCAWTSLPRSHSWKTPMWCSLGTSTPPLA